jgi:CHC2 zinc finger
MLPINSVAPTETAKVHHSPGPNAARSFTRAMVTAKRNSKQTAILSDKSDVPEAAGGSYPGEAIATESESHDIATMYETSAVEDIGSSLRQLFGNGENGVYTAEQVMAAATGAQSHDIATTCEAFRVCPVCGDGGKGNRSDRFAVHPHKNTWLCLRCPAGGGVIDLVMHLDGVDFRDAVEELTGKRPATPQRSPAVQPLSSADADDNHRRAMRQCRRKPCR